MAGKKQAEGKAANTTEKAANSFNTEATPQQPTPQVANPFELRIKNNGRRRLLQFCGVSLDAGKTTTVTLKNQLEVDHVKDTLRQFNELAGRNDLVVEEGE